MHANQREHQILRLIEQRGFLSFQELDATMDASPATLRRDLERLAREGLIERIRGGAKQIGKKPVSVGAKQGLSGVPFHENATKNTARKQSIGRAAAALCVANEGVMIDGGSTTLQMCPYLDGLSLQVLTNSLHIVSALLPQIATRILVLGGSVFREQNIILSAAGEETMPQFHAPKLFMGAAAVGAQGVMQADVILVAAERRLIDRADEIIILVDSSKFLGSSGNVVCPLEEVDTIITDDGIGDKHVQMIEAAGVKLVVAKT